MAGTNVDASRIMATDAYRDYVACVVNGTSQADRARERGGISPSTVSANIRRIRDHIRNGDIVDPATTSTGDGGNVASTVVNVDPVAIADAMRKGAGMFVDRLTRLDADADRVRDRINRANDDMARIDAARADVHDMASAVGFDIDAWRTAVDDARNASTTDDDNADTDNDNADATGDDNA